jgi:hypothetical protein
MITDTSFASMMRWDTLFPKLPLRAACFATITTRKGIFILPNALLIATFIT